MQYLRLTIALLLAVVVGGGCATDDFVESEPAPPRAVLSGQSSLGWDLEVGQSTHAEVVLTNVGEQILEYDIVVDVDWVEVYPVGGDLAEQESEAIDLQITCPQEIGDYEAGFEIITNDPRDEVISFSAPLRCNPLAPGELEIEITGLPDGEAGDVRVEGPEDFFVELVESTTLDGLSQGSYRVVAFSVGDEAIYRPEPEELIVEVESGSTVAAGIDYEAVPGSVQVEVEGLSGIQPELTLERGTESWDVPADGRLDGLEPGLYTVVAPEIDDGETVYQASDVDVFVVSDEVTTVIVEYVADAGSLEVTVSGLPAGIYHDIDVIREGSVVATLPQSGELSALTPGVYEIVPRDVVVDEATYEADGTTVVIETGVTTTATVNYEVVEGSLPVVINGLPEELDADVVIVSGQYSHDVSASTTVHEITPGTYDVVVIDVVDGLYTYRGESTTVVVESGINDPLVINYELVRAELTIEVVGDLGGADADIVVEGPEGYATTVTGQTTLDQLLPGDYSVTVNNVFDGAATYAGEGSTVLTLGSEDSETVTATYELLTSGIAVDVTTYGDAPFEVRMTGPDGFSETIDASVVFSEVSPGDYELSVEAIPIDGLGNEGYVTVDPSAFTLSSDDTVTIEIEAASGTVVTHGGDDGPGSLRQVVESVVDASIVEFGPDVSEIGLTTGPISIDGSFDIVAEGDVSVDGGGSRIFSIAAGSAVILEGMVLRGGWAHMGGALFVEDGADSTPADVLLDRLVFEQNSADESGGAIYVGGAASIYITRSVFDDNAADTRGGAISTPNVTSDALTMHIEASLFTNNTSTNGGALYLTGHNEVWESTFFGNIAGNRGGALYADRNEVHLLGCTIVGNEADEGGGIFHWADGLVSGSIGRSIVAENQAIEGVDIQLSSIGDPENFESLGYNVAGVAGGDIVDGVNGDQAGSESDRLDPGLQALADNGGPTETMALWADSPARLNVPAVACEEMSGRDFLRDQRNRRRPAGAFCSAGAFEIEAPTETFDNADMSASSYDTGNFEGDHGIVWFYEDVRRNTQGYYIEGTSIILRDDPSSRIYTEAIAGGVSSVSMQLSKAFTGSGDRQVELYVNGNFVDASEPFDEDGDPPYPIYRFAVEDLNISGDFVLEIRSAGRQVVVDNVTWE